MAGGVNMEAAMIVLGRFQPFHKGHAAMVSAALEHLEMNSEGTLRICIGSSEAEESLENPWTANEREQMIRAWLDKNQASNSKNAEIIQVLRQRSATSLETPAGVFGALRSWKDNF